MKFRTKTYNITESFDDISIKTDTTDIVFVPSEDESCTVECFDEIKAPHTVQVKNNTLSIDIDNQKKWYDHIGISFRSPKITIALPYDAYKKLVISSDTGDVKIAQIAFEKLDISLSTGSVKSNADVSGDVYVKTSTGDVSLEGVTADNVTLSVSTGDIKLTDVIAKQRLDIATQTGDIKLDRCDGGDITIKTSTGDVKGTIISDKVYIAKTDTGKIRVPETTSGGRCKITTNTGSIIINK